MQGGGELEFSSVLASAFSCDLLQSSPKTLKVGSISPIRQVSKLGLREVR